MTTAKIAISLPKDQLATASGGWTRLAQSSLSELACGAGQTPLRFNMWHAAVSLT
jgi:hypothetical protein